MGHKLKSENRKENYGSPYKEFGRFNLGEWVFAVSKIIKGGKGKGGFWNAPGSELTLKEAAKDGEYKQAIKNLQKACKKFLDFCEENSI